MPLPDIYRRDQTPVVRSNPVSEMLVQRRLRKEVERLQERNALESIRRDADVAADLDYAAAAVSTGCRMADTLVIGFEIIDQKVSGDELRAHAVGGILDRMKRAVEVRYETTFPSI